ncbi:alpha/beta hydrolase-fold protein [Fusobacterium sp.]|uniref:alpha/beta hydrolase n=1 Tax=Fusobacterium sp. TaxID=68766 RepID=UPI0025B8D8D7|nr:alpha/beta hydrolase-fold protein [Fusobacterium sp.]
MIKFFIILAGLGLLFYVVTYPYAFKLSRKIRRVLSFEEVTYIENQDFDYSRISPEDQKKRLVMERKILKNEHITEELEYVVIKNSDEKRDDLPCLILLHGLRDSSNDWLERGRIRENYLTLLDQGKIDKLNIVLINSGCNGMSWYTNFYRDRHNRYEECLVKGLLSELKQEFPKSQFGIAGFSMGGYGAFKLGLKNLDIFKVIGSFSGAISIVRMSVNRRVIRIFNFLYIPKQLFTNEDKLHFLRVFGSWGYKILKEDPYTLTKRLPESKYRDRYFYLSVGEKDVETHLMLQQWLDTVRRMKKHKYNFIGYLCKNETHTWEYVARDLKNFLVYFNEKIKL